MPVKTNWPTEYLLEHFAAGREIHQVCRAVDAHFEFGPDIAPTLSGSCVEIRVERKEVILAFVLPEGCRPNPI